MEAAARAIDHRILPSPDGWNEGQAESVARAALAAALPHLAASPGPGEIQRLRALVELAKEAGADECWDTYEAMDETGVGPKEYPCGVCAPCRFHALATLTTSKGTGNE